MVNNCKRNSNTEQGISKFGKEFVTPGKIGKRYSEMIHGAFDLRLACDYKDLIAASVDDAANEVKQARAFIDAINTLVEGWWASVEF